jgi:hypothetical protein
MLDAARLREILSLLPAAFLRAAGATSDGVLVAGDPATWQTLVYCKPHVADEELSRLDMGAFNGAGNGTRQEAKSRSARPGKRAASG